ncbi:MAG: DMT family transporter [Verrucomicrobiota bacterium JB022]|nr:DMT family transporter [Verrucomicrobiota bacterium JB022]
MQYLIAVTILWAFSFSLIGVYLSGQVDNYFAVLMRIGVATAVFLPLVRWGSVRLGRIWPLLAIGAVQLGLMYIFYYRSFLLLTVPEVLLFTIFTPLYVTLLYDALRLRFSPWYLATAGLAVLGAAVMRYDGLTQDYWLGFLVVQGSNLCFAAGQVAYKRLREREQAQRGDFAFFYVGALLVAFPAWLLWGQPQYPTTGLQWGILLWLGAGASGLGYFLWNLGATKVNAGTLAIMNNALIPAGLLVNLLIWNREANLLRLTLGGLLIVASVWVNERWAKNPS